MAARDFRSRQDINTFSQVVVPGPVGSVQVIRTDFGDIGSKTGVDNFYTVTSGTILTIQILLGGSESSTGGSIIEIFDDPNGDLSILNRLSTLFVNGTSDEQIVNQILVGDGTRRVVLRRRTYTNSNREMFAQWIGFEVTT